MTFQRSFACLLALLVIFIVEVPTHSAARLTTVGDVKSSHLQSNAVAVDMMRYYHVNSPYAKQNLTFEQSVDIAVKSSLARGKYFRDLIYGKTSYDSDKAVITSPLMRAGGSYIMQISLGTPARTFFAFADTGSDLFWVKCAPCDAPSCSSANVPVPIFDPAASSTYQPLSCAGNGFCSVPPLLIQPACSISGTCLYDFRYGSGETVGDLALDTVTLPTTEGTTEAFPNFAFGCSHSNTVDFNGVSGLVGLAQGRLSLVRQVGPEFGDVFSYCLVDFLASRTRTSPLLLGSPGPVPLQYTPLLTNNRNVRVASFYYVEVVGITVDGVAVQYPPDAFDIHSDGSGGLFLDSGTTLTLLDAPVYMLLTDRLQSLITYPRVAGSNPDLQFCYDISGIANPTFPVMAFQFRNVNLDLPQENILFPGGFDDVMCLAFVKSSGESIYGNVAQQNFQVAYDRANKRVGFAPRNC